MCSSVCVWLPWAQSGRSWAGWVVLGWLPLPPEHCRAAPTPAWDFWCHQQLLLGWRERQQPCPAFEQQVDWHNREQLYFALFLGIFWGTFGGSDCEDQVQVLEQPVDAQGIPQDLYFQQQERDQPLWLIPVLLLFPSHPTPSTRRKGGTLCWKSRQRALLPCRVPQLCAGNFQQAAKAAPRLTPKFFGVFGSKGVQLHSQSRASEEGSGQGTGGKRCSVLQGRNRTNLGPPGEEYDKFRSQSSKCSHRTLALGFQGFVEFKQVSSGQDCGGRSCTFRHFKCCSLSFPPPKLFL